MKKNIIAFSKTVIVNMVVLFMVFSPASAGVGLYGKQQSSSSSQTGESRQSLLSPSDGSIGLFDNASQSALTATPGNVGSGHGSHVPVADGVGLLLLMAGGYILKRKFSNCSY
jgi:hypothetical protein